MQVTVVTVENSLGCEIFREECTTQQEIRCVVVALLENLADGDSFHFEVIDK